MTNHHTEGDTADVAMINRITEAVYLHELERTVDAMRDKLKRIIEVASSE